MSLLIYYEMAHYAGIDKRRYGSIRPYDGAIYGLLATLPMVIIQIIISQLDLSIKGVDFATLKMNLIKGFAAPMLFIAKLGYYKIGGYALAWSTIVIVSFLGYFAGYKNFDLSEYFRKLFGLQPKKKGPPKRKRKYI